MDYNNNSIKGSNTPIIKCSQVIAYNNSYTVTKFGLKEPSSFNSTVIYESGNYSKGETWTLDLKTLNVYVGSQFYVKAIVAGNDSLSDVIIEYDPNIITTAYFELTGNAFNTSLTFITIVDSTVDLDTTNCKGPKAKKNLTMDNYNTVLSTPVLVCSAIMGKNYTWTVMKWALYTLDGVNVYTSGNQNLGDYFDFTLSDLSVNPGTQLKLKALVTMGDDSVADIILEYHPTSNVTGYFELDGSAFKTVVVYKGTSNPWY